VAACAKRGQPARRTSRPMMRGLRAISSVITISGGASRPLITAVQ
jgi:hypothetical protein